MNGPPLDPPVPSVRKAARPVFFLTLIGTVAWLAAIVLAPVLRSRGSGAAPFLYALFSPVCHQIPGRSFVLLGFPLAVCGRCFGIYAGFLAGLVLYPAVRGFRRIALPPVRLFVLAGLPAGLDFFLGVSRLWDSPLWLRFGTGFIWGVLLPYYFVTGISELVLWRAARKAAGTPAPGRDGGALDNSGRKTVK